MTPTISLIVVTIRLIDGINSIIDKIVDGLKTYSIKNKKGIKKIYQAGLIFSLIWDVQLIFSSIPGAPVL